MLHILSLKQLKAITEIYVSCKQCISHKVNTKHDGEFHSVAVTPKAVNPQQHPWAAGRAVMACQ